MSHTIPLSEVGPLLNELVARLAPGDEVVLTRDNEPVARVVPAAPPPGDGPRSGFGAGKDMLIKWVDDDEHLKDFEEYM